MGLGELRFLDWLAKGSTPHGRVVVGIGDDAAVVRAGLEEGLVLAADAVAEGTHFEPGTDPRLIGRKALACNLSDLAAMGATPLCALATLTLPTGAESGVAEAIVTGIRALGDACDCPLVGGDTTTHRGGIVVSVTVAGLVKAPAPILRSGARPGDVIAVTGAVGGSRKGRHLRFEPRLAEAQRLLELGPPSAMIDLSDGLALDLWRIADASGLGFVLDLDAVPLHADCDPARDVDQAIGEGEDFELLFCASPPVWERIRAAWGLPVPVTRIGTVGGEGRWWRQGGATRKAEPRGYAHE